MWKILGIPLTVAICLGNGLSFSADETQPDATKKAIVRQLQVIFAKDAGEYSIYRDPERREKLELHSESVYNWTNVLRRQDGSVFVWTWHGRPEVVASIFSNPAPMKGKRAYTHEFHSLSNSILIPERESENQWKPQAGLKRKPVPDVPAPAENGRQRLFQMREISRDFTAKSIDHVGNTWELRLLPQPLFRYQSTDPKIIDGALFTFVTSAGTDPEVMLLIEATKMEDGPVWSYAVCRFSDLELHVRYREDEVWASVLGGENAHEHDAQHLYRLFRDRRVDEIVPETEVP